MLNQKGFSLVQTLVAASVLAAVALGAATLKTNISKEFERTRILKDVSSLHLRIKRLLAVRGICNATFGTQPLASNPPISNLVAADTNTIYQAGSTYDKNIEITSMRVRNHSVEPLRPNEDRFAFEINYKVNDPAFLFGYEATKYMTIEVKTNAGAFVACFTPGYIGFDDEYINHFGPETRVGDLNIMGELAIVRNPSDGTGGFVTAVEYLQSSDRNLKTDIHPLRLSSSLLHEIKGYSYIRGKPGKLEYGFLAQEIENIAPLVKTNQQGLKSVKYSNLLAAQIEGTKNLLENQRTLRNAIQSERLKLRSVEKELDIRPDEYPEPTASPDSAKTN